MRGILSRALALFMVFGLFSGILAMQVTGSRFSQTLIPAEGTTDYGKGIEMQEYKQLGAGIEKDTLLSLIRKLEQNNIDEVYDDYIAAATAVVENQNASQLEIDQQYSILMGQMQYVAMENPVDFDEDNIVISFGAISDIHLNENATSIAHGSIQKYRNALIQLKAQAGGTLDAITVAGDFAGDRYKPIVTDFFKEVTTEILGQDAKAFFVTGNHDTDPEGYVGLNKFFTEMAQYTAEDLPSSNHARGNRHAIINGYHFIGINMMDYWNRVTMEATFHQEDLDWLEDALAEARQHSPGKPIFVYSHAAVYGTTYGSTLYTSKPWASKSIYPYLEKYPEVVMFTGHLHYPVNDDRSIHQRDFTTLNCGSICYISLDDEGYLEKDDFKTSNDLCYQVSNGLLVQLDKNDNMRVTKMNFMQDETYKEPWVISAPDAAKTHLLYYNEASRSKPFNKEPEFIKPFSAADAPSVSFMGSDTTVSYPAAVDDEMVHHYKIEIKGLPGGDTKTFRSYSEFYLHSKVEDFPKRYTKTVPYNLSDYSSYYIKIYAVDSFGLESKPIKISPYIKDIAIPPNASGGNIIHVDFATGAARNGTRSSGYAIVNQKGGQISLDDRTSFFSPAQRGYVEAIPNETVLNTILSTNRGLALEAYFTVDSFSETERILFSSLKGDKGMGLTVTPRGKIKYTVNTNEVSSVLEGDITTGKQYHVMATYSPRNGSAELYINGEQVALEEEITGDLDFGEDIIFNLGGSRQGMRLDGSIVFAGLHSSTKTASEVLERYQTVTQSSSYKNLKDVFDDIAYAQALLDINSHKGEHITSIIQYYLEALNAVSHMVPYAAGSKNPVFAVRDEMITNLENAGGDTDVPYFAMPIVTGVEDGGVYNDTVYAGWDVATSAFLDGEEYIKDTPIGEGRHELFVRNGYQSVAMEFEVLEGINVFGVEEGAEYDIQSGEAISVSWQPESATATLNGEAYVAGSEITDTGDYVLVVTLGDKTVTVSFAVIDTAPIIKGDVTGDGEVKIDDALLILRIVAKIIADPTPYQLEAGDVTGDGEIKIDDAIKVLRLVAGLIPTLD